MHKQILTVNKYCSVHIGCPLFLLCPCFDCIAPFLIPWFSAPFVCFTFTLLVPVSFVLGYPICFCILCFGLCSLCLCPFCGGFTLFVPVAIVLGLPSLFPCPLFWVYLPSSCNRCFRLPFLFLHWNILRLLIGEFLSHFFPFFFPWQKNKKFKKKIIKTVLLESDLWSVGIN